MLRRVAWPSLTGQELKRLRLQLGLTQKALAMRLGIQRNTVTRWEMGRHPINPVIAIAIGAVLAAERQKRKGGR